MYLAKSQDSCVQVIDFKRVALSLAALLFRYRSNAKFHSNSEPCRIAVQATTSFKTGGTPLLNNFRSQQQTMIDDSIKLLRVVARVTHPSSVRLNSVRNTILSAHRAIEINYFAA